MADDNNFSLGDILWEYADFTPPEIPARPSVPLPPVEPQAPKPSAPSQPKPGITSPQPVAPAKPTSPPPKAQPVRPAHQPLPANEPLPANQAPVAPKQPAKAPVPPANANGAPSAPPSPPKPAAPKAASAPIPEPPKAPPAQAPDPKAPPAKEEDPKATPQPAPAPNQTPAGQPAAAPPAAGDQAGQGPSPAQEPPKEAPKPQETPQGEQPPQASPPPAQEAGETGVPLDDGPEILVFSPDPKATKEKETEAQGQEGQPEGSQEGPSPEGQPPEAPPQEGQADQAPSQDQPEQQTDQGPQPPPGPKAPGPQPNGPQPGGQTKQPTTQTAAEGFHPFRDRKPRAEEPVPPDAPPGQLAAEYAQGLRATKGKCTAAGILSVFLLLFALLDSDVFPFLTGLLPDTILLWGSFALFLVCLLLCLDVVKEGLLQLTNLAPNGDTLALFAALFTLVDGVTMVFTPLRESAIPFFSPCALVLTFHLLGRYCDRSAKFQACRVAASVSQPYLVTQDPNGLGGRTVFRKWLGTPKGFGSQIRTTSQAERRFRRLTPVLMVACFCLSLVTTVAHHQPKLIFWSLSALFTASATLGVSLSLNLPLRLLGSKLAKLGVALAGWPGLMAGQGCKAVLLLDHDVYPPGTVALTGSRVFGSLSMERTVSFTASVIRASGSGLTYLFDKLLRAEGGSYLPIEKIVMQETGLIGQCQGQEILVGNSDFMSRQGIALPPGIRTKDAVFCAVSRELVGMFVLKYTLHPSIIPSLQSLVSHRVAPVMVTRDFNLTPHRLRLWGRLPMDQLTFPDLQRRVILSAPNQVHGSTILAVLCREGLAPFSQAILGSKRIRRAALFSSAFVNISACVGVVLTATLSSAGALGAMCAWHLSLFLLLWLVPVLLISLWTTQY